MLRIMILLMVLVLSSESHAEKQQQRNYPLPDIYKFYNLDALVPDLKQQLEKPGHSGQETCSQLIKLIFPYELVWPHMQSHNLYELLNPNLELAEDLLGGNVNPDRLNCVSNVSGRSVLGAAVEAAAYMQSRPSGNSAVDEVISERLMKVTKLLLEKRADPNYIWRSMRPPPLHVAVMQMKGTKLADMLIKHGADMDMVWDGSTLLIDLIRDKNKDLDGSHEKSREQIGKIIHLIQGGANIDVRDKNGKTAFYYYRMLEYEKYKYSYIEQLYSISPYYIEEKDLGNAHELDLWNIEQ